MTWFKVDDKLHGNVKVLEAGHAMALWVLAGSWCADHLTDGFIPDVMCRRLLSESEGMPQTLEKVGLWVKSERDGRAGWQFANWTEYQPTKEEVEAKRERDRVRKRKKPRNANGTYKSASDAPLNVDNVTPISGRIPRGGPKESEASPFGFHAEAERNPNGLQPSRPVPSRPDPNPTRKTSSSSSSNSKNTRENKDDDDDCIPQTTGVTSGWRHTHLTPTATHSETGYTLAVIDTVRETHPAQARELTTKAVASHLAALTGPVHPNRVRAMARTLDNHTPAEVLDAIETAAERENVQDVWAYARKILQTNGQGEPA